MESELTSWYSRSGHHDYLLALVTSNVLGDPFEGDLVQQLGRWFYIFLLYVQSLTHQVSQPLRCNHGETVSTVVNSSLDNHFINQPTVYNSWTKSDFNQHITDSQMNSEPKVTSIYSLWRPLVGKAKQEDLAPLHFKHCSPWSIVCMDNDTCTNAWFHHHFLWICNAGIFVAHCNLPYRCSIPLFHYTYVCAYMIIMMCNMSLLWIFYTI